MREKFRQSISWLHTWSGLIIGWLLFAIFFTGTYSYFRNEITYWMQPELHGSIPTGSEASMAVNYLERVAPDSPSWSITLPDARNRVVQVVFREQPQQIQAPERPGKERPEGAENTGRQPRDEGRAHTAAEGGDKPDNTKNTQQENATPVRVPMTVHYLDSQTGERIIPRETRGGTFLYRFHVELYGMDRMTGRKIIGAATMVMFIAIISGVIIHKRIFADFFTFRRKKGTRSWTDAHIFTAVLALPYHIMITYSGLVLFMMILLPWNADGMRRMHSHAQPAQTVSYEERVKLTPVEPLIKNAEERLKSKIQRISISNQGKKNMLIEMVPSGRKSITATGRGSGTAVQVAYNGVNGRFMGEAVTSAPNAVAATANVLGSLHLARFADTFTRWLFFISGVLGTAMVGTGLIIWTHKKSKAMNKSFGRKLVEVLNVGGMTGLTAATAVHLWSNRLLPFDLASRANWEIRLFFTAWLLCCLHPLVRPVRKAWTEQLAFCAALYCLLPVLNAFTSKVNLFSAIAQGNAIIAGFDLTVFGFGLLFGYAAWKTSEIEEKKPSAAAQGVH
ncbi:PepSY-associated TM helix domain-containing protein [Geovibrio thiophilus]|nr:PepSY-associated TM helix domain-containing protein [Geovibrio thiophilus]